MFKRTLAIVFILCVVAVAFIALADSPQPGAHAEHPIYPPPPGTRGYVPFVIQRLPTPTATPTSIVGALIRLPAGASMHTPSATPPVEGENCAASVWVRNNTDWVLTEPMVHLQLAGGTVTERSFAAYVYEGNWDPGQTATNLTTGWLPEEGCELVSCYGTGRIVGSPTPTPVPPTATPTITPRPNQVDLDTEASCYSQDYSLHCSVLITNPHTVAVRDIILYIRLTGSAAEQQWEASVLGELEPGEGIRRDMGWGGTRVFWATGIPADAPTPTVPVGLVRELPAEAVALVEASCQISVTIWNDTEWVLTEPMAHLQMAGGAIAHRDVEARPANPYWWPGSEATAIVEWPIEEGCQVVSVHGSGMVSDLATPTPTPSPTPVGYVALEASLVQCWENNQMYQCLAQVRNPHDRPMVDVIAHYRYQTTDSETWIPLRDYRIRCLNPGGTWHQHVEWFPRWSFRLSAGGFPGHRLPTPRPGSVELEWHGGCTWEEGICKWCVITIMNPHTTAVRDVILFNEFGLCGASETAIEGRLPPGESLPVYPECPSASGGTWMATGIRTY
ncbi:MAG: hypothetical protein JXA74_14010 [Anaerolineae bacterium]|nr:hypothetical protein [Anaerolineae bacterium]